MGNDTRVPGFALHAPFAPGTNGTVAALDADHETSGWMDGEAPSTVVALARPRRRGWRGYQGRRECRTDLSSIYVDWNLLSNPSCPYQHQLPAFILPFF